MSFFSRSSNGRHYRNGNKGSSHYQNKGLFGNLIDMFASRSRSHGNYGNYGNQPNNVQSNNRSANQNFSICSKCNSQIPAGSKFCLQCGEKVNSVPCCINCGEKLPPDAKFCNSCGSKVSK